MHRYVHKLARLPRAVGVRLIRLYRLFLSPHIGNNCLYTPSCSVYTEQAIQNFGLAQGSYLGALRIVRCAPWCQGGHDPVPHSFTFFPK